MNIIANILILGRARIVSISGIVGAAAALFFVFALWENRLPLLYVSLVFNGIFYEIFSSASEAIFADSAGLVGKRTELYVKKSMWSSSAAAAGPVVFRIFYHM